MEGGPVSLDIEKEVAFGEEQEERILERWLPLSKFAEEADSYRRSDTYRAFDFYVEAKGGYVRCYVEVKRRRTPFAKYGDLLVPLKKHHEAASEASRTGIPHIVVTEYGCGTLVEADLSQKPFQTRDIKRRDRPRMRPVPHAFYSRSQLTVLAGP
jgi:hypothetical protein